MANERPMLMSGPMVRAILENRSGRHRIYVKSGESTASPEHIARRLANALDAAPDGGCWNWQRTTNAYGYGTLRIGSKTRLAHRVAYELTFGPIPDGLHVLHSCDNPSCINPEHLHAGTASENMRECSERGRAKIPHPIKLGEQNGASKLSAVDVRSIRRLLHKGLTQQSIADRFGVTQRTISDIKLGKKWSHVQ